MPLTKTEAKRIDMTIVRIVKKLDNIEAGQRFLAMVELDEAEKRYRRAKAIYEQMQKVRARPRRRKARR